MKNCIRLLPFYHYLDKLSVNPFHKLFNLIKTFPIPIFIFRQMFKTERHIFTFITINLFFKFVYFVVKFINACII